MVVEHQHQTIVSTDLGQFIRHEQSDETSMRATAVERKKREVEHHFTHLDVALLNMAYVYNLKRPHPSPEH